MHHRKRNCWLKCSHQLKSRSPFLKILILERGYLPAGASTRNAGFACFGSISELLMDMQTESESDVMSLVEKRWRGLQNMRQVLGDEVLNYEALGGYELFTSGDAIRYEMCSAKIEHFNHLLSSITKQTHTYLNADKNIVRFGFSGVDHMIVNTGEGQIDTGKMMEALIEKASVLGIKILNGIKVEKYIDENPKVRVIVTGNENIYCDKLLICTNGFAPELIDEIDVEPARAQVLVTEPLENILFRGTFHYDEGYYYFRNIGTRVLLGGGRNLAFEQEKTSTDDLNDMIQRRLEDLLGTMIVPGQNVRIARRWSGIMGLGSSKKSIVKKISPSAYCAVRLGGMGVAIGNLVAAEAADLILDDL